MAEGGQDPQHGGAMEAAEEQAEANLQQTAAFWLSRLELARGAGVGAAADAGAAAKAAAAAAEAEAAMEAKARLADRRVAASPTLHSLYTHFGW